MIYVVGRIDPQGRRCPPLRLSQEAAYAYARSCFVLGCAFYWRRIP